MKTRLGFVSNSSSVSFVIALIKEQKVEKCKCCGHESYPKDGLFDILKNRKSCCGEEPKIISGITNSNTLFYDEPNVDKNRLEKLNKEGIQIISLEFSKHDSELFDILNKLQDDGKIEILGSDCD